jgi:hypothetical protein
MPTTPGVANERMRLLMLTELQNSCVPELQNAEDSTWRAGSDLFDLFTPRVVCRYDPDSTTQSVPQRALEDLNARLKHLERRLEATTSQGSTDDEAHLAVHVADIRKGAVSTDITTLRYISEMIDATDEEANLLSLQQTTPGSGQPSHPPQDPSVPTDAPRISCFPIDADLDALIEKNMKLAYPLFPILFIPSSENDYKLCRASGAGGCSKNATFHATVNIICALGCLLGADESQTFNASRATSFYERTRSLVPLDCFDHPTLADVQLLLLVVQYPTFTVYTNRAYQTLAVAIRIAQGLGLDRDAYSSLQNEVEQEMARCVWHLCLIFERCFTPGDCCALIKTHTELSSF